MGTLLVFFLGVLAMVGFISSWNALFEKNEGHVKYYLREVNGGYAVLLNDPWDVAYGMDRWIDEKGQWHSGRIPPDCIPIFKTKEAAYSMLSENVLATIGILAEKTPSIACNVKLRFYNWLKSDC